MALKSIGKMREVVLFLQNTPSAAAGRGATDNYSTLLTTRGQLIDKSGDTRLSFGEIGSSNYMTLVCRFQTSLASNLRTDTRIVISGVTYKYTTYRLVDQKKHLYEFEIQSLTQ